MVHMKELLKFARSLAAGVLFAGALCAQIPDTPAGRQFSAWLTAFNSGAPFTAQISGYNRSGNLNTTNFSLNERPNLKPGRSNNPILGGPDHPHTAWQDRVHGHAARGVLVFIVAGDAR